MNEKTIFNFKIINSLLLFFLVYSNLRYFKISFNFTGVNEFNFIQFFGEMSFYLSLFISFIYLLEINKKKFKNLITLFFGWVVISLIFQYHLLDFSYLKKSIQIFLCFYIFIVFSEQKEKINFILLESLTVTFLTLIALFSFFYYELYLAGLIYVFSFFIFLILIKNKILFYKFSILFFFVIFIYIQFYINPQYDYLDIEAFVRKNSISWFVLLIFVANKLFREQQNFYLDLFITIFTLLFLSKYIFFIILLIYTLIFISRKKIFILDYILLFSFVIPILYTLIIGFFTSHFIEFISFISNYIYDLDNLGIILGVDENFQKTYQVSQINYHTSNFFTEIYLGLVHRALLAEIFFLNIINNFHIDENYLLEIKYYSALIIESFNPKDSTYLNNFKNSEFINNYSLYFKKCMDLSMKIDECASHFGFITNENNVSQNILQIVFNQKFNSSHNQFIDIISNFGKLGILIFLFLLFQVIKILINSENNYRFKILIITILLVINFDNYLFYNYFNISFLIWTLLGISINSNYSKKINY